MKAAVLHINTAKYDSDAPTMRIARFVAEELGIPLIHNVESATLLHRKKFDVLFVKYGILKFSQHRDMALDIYSKAGRIIDLQNDYLMKPDSRFKRANARYEVWGTVPDNVALHGGQYINWNMLTWDHKFKPLPWPRLPGLFYYGAARIGRIATLGRYYGQHVPYPVTVSANPRNAPFFRALNTNATVISKCSHAEIAKYGLTVYMEDDTSHGLYCSLANRFYECLHLGVPMLFDSACTATLEKAGLKRNHYLPFLCDRHKDVAEALRSQGYLYTEHIAAKQREYWHKNYRLQLQKALHRAAAGVL